MNVAMLSGHRIEGSPSKRWQTWHGCLTVPCNDLGGKNVPTLVGRMCPIDFSRLPLLTRVLWIANRFQDDFSFTVVALLWRRPDK